MFLGPIFNPYTGRIQMPGSNSPERPEPKVGEVWNFQDEEGRMQGSTGVLFHVSPIAVRWIGIANCLVVLHRDRLTTKHRDDCLCCKDRRANPRQARGNLPDEFYPKAHAHLPPKTADSLKAALEVRKKTQSIDGRAKEQSTPCFEVSRIKDVADEADTSPIRLSGQHTPTADIVATDPRENPPLSTQPKTYVRPEADSDCDVCKGTGQIGFVRCGCTFPKQATCYGCKERPPREGSRLCSRCASD